jgi:hypothetical protein
MRVARTRAQWSRNTPSSAMEQHFTDRPHLDRTAGPGLLQFPRDGERGVEVVGLHHDDASQRKVLREMWVAAVRADRASSSLRQIRPQGRGALIGAPTLERTIDMAKFIYLYRGPATPMPDSTPEQAAERMAAGANLAAWQRQWTSASRRRLSSLPTPWSVALI